MPFSVGEHQPQIRTAICRHHAWLSVTVDDAANALNATWIDGSDSKIAVFVIPTDEEQVIADKTWSIQAAEKAVR